MNAKTPPVPPQNRSPAGTGEDGRAPLDKTPPGTPTRRQGAVNLDQQDQEGNTKQNTTHQGYQQDR